ncbi:hypothetical protein AVEN_186114-1 [Araneus ventricosus]|uniref:Uncharacterized protein n=1 Tax=Araneus ventricosus TaxID=182803 RepID=A0A4Y2T8F0_ARAVE|nr:hypothetical protein AVEN_186114-1 [Araneus ventricosus]
MGFHRATPHTPCPVQMALRWLTPPTLSSADGAGLPPTLSQCRWCMTAPHSLSSADGAAMAYPPTSCPVQHGAAMASSHSLSSADSSWFTPNSFQCVGMAYQTSEVDSDSS